MLATFAFDVCHDVYLAAREAIDTKIPTLNSEASGKYLWRPDRMPRLAEYVCDFAMAGERALGGGSTDFRLCALRAASWAAKDGERKLGGGPLAGESSRGDGGPRTDRLRRTDGRPQAEACATKTFRASRMAMFRVYYLGGAEYQAARRHLGISEFTWSNWADEIRRAVGRELTRAGVFPPSKYFLETAARAS
jgi:hypothetical protein